MDFRREPTALILSIASKLCQQHVLSRNGSGFLKSMLFRGDERLLFITHRFIDKKITVVQLLNEIKELCIREAQHLFDHLFSLCSLEEGKKLSNNERKEKKLSQGSLTYGEIDFVSFCTILRKVCCGNNVSQKVFIDLGSGTGRAVVAARLMEDFAVCEGMELLESLHSASTNVLKFFESSGKQFLHYSSPTEVRVSHESILTYDWSHGDVVFANSTCFDAALMQSISQQAEKLKAGSILISFTKSLVSDKFELLERCKFTMSWGPATVFIHRRLSDNGEALGPSPLNKWKMFTDSCTRLGSPARPTTAPSTPPVDSEGFNSSTDKPQQDVQPRGAAPLSSEERGTGTGAGISILVDSPVAQSSSSTSSAGSLSVSSPSTPSPKRRARPAGTNSTSSSPYKPEDLDGTADPSSVRLATPSSLLAGKHVQFSFSSTTNPGLCFKLALWAPLSYSSENYADLPLLVYLHGSSARGSSCDPALGSALPRLLSHAASLVTDGGVHMARSPTHQPFLSDQMSALRLPCIVLSPVCPNGMEWKSPSMCGAIMELIDLVISSFSLDKNRLYLTGISMGGLGTWMLAARNPDRFAAIIPICGGGSPVYARLLKNVPWYDV